MTDVVFKDIKFIVNGTSKYSNNNVESLLLKTTIQWTIPNSSLIDSLEQYSHKCLVHQDRNSEELVRLFLLSIIKQSNITVIPRSNNLYEVSIEIKQCTQETCNVLPEQ